MNAIVVYESMYGNTRAVAQAIADGLGGAQVTAVSEPTDLSPPADLTVVGGPTHMHGLSTAMSRRAAAEAAKEDGADPTESGGTAGPGLRGWLGALPDGHGARAAAFDTRLDKPPVLTGVAARGVARRLRRRGYEVLSTESFLVLDAQGPLEDGELERARAWGAQLATLMAAAGAGSQTAGSRS
jgi:flavodoxin